MKGDLPSLDLAVVTYLPEGINRVERMVLPPIDGVRYVVSWQDHRDAPVPESLRLRTDVSIHRFDGRGISANRNNALERSRADVVLFADDDLTYYEHELDNLRMIFAQIPELDVATVRSDHSDAGRFPVKETRLGRRLPKGYYVTSFEIAFRRSRCGDLRCCPELGLGSEMLHGGEDEIFLQTAIRRGFDCRFFPITVCAHPHESTGTKGAFTRGNMLAFGCVIAMMYPLTAVLRIPLKAFRIWRGGQAGFGAALGSMVRGALMTHGVRKRNRDCLW